MQRILGIDPGLNTTGYGLLHRSPRGPQLDEAGVIRAGSGGELPCRLDSIYQGVRDLIALYQPTVVAIEQLYSHYQHPRTAILMGHARGVICLAAGQQKISVHNYAATQVKKLLTGNGRAPKIQMQRAIQRELQLAELPDPADVADALAIALCHYYLADRGIPIG